MIESRFIDIEREKTVKNLKEMNEPSTSNAAGTREASNTKHQILRMKDMNLRG